MVNWSVSDHMKLSPEPFWHQNISNLPFSYFIEFYRSKDSVEFSVIYEFDNLGQCQKFTYFKDNQGW